jgi:hypothetical protein
MGKKRIIGDDRALMMICRAARRYWEFYSSARKQVLKDSHCNKCGFKVGYVEVDHEPPLGSRPRKFEELGDWMNRLFYGPQQGLCKEHHAEKTRAQRKVAECKKKSKSV